MINRNELPPNLNLEETILLLFFQHQIDVRKIAYALELDRKEIESTLRTHFADLHHTLRWSKCLELSKIF